MKLFAQRHGLAIAGLALAPAAVGSSCGPAETTAAERVTSRETRSFSARLDEYASQAADDGEIRVIVRFRSTDAAAGPFAADDPDPLSERDVVDARGAFLGLAGQRAAATAQAYPLAPFLAISLTADEIRALQKDLYDPELDALRIEISDVGEVTADFAPPLELRDQSPASPQFFVTLQEVVAHTGASALHEKGLRGATQAIVVIDDGVDGDWPQLTMSPRGAKVVAGSHHVTRYDYLSQEWVTDQAQGVDEGRPYCSSNATDCETFEQGDPSHGTCVAIVASGVEVEKFGMVNLGMAPEASLIAVRIDGASGKKTTEDLGHALAEVLVDWSEEHPVACVNLSLGTRETYAEEEEALALASAGLVHFYVEALEDAGIPVVASAGNAQADALSFPACLDTAVAVASVLADDATAVESNWSDAVDIAAYGSTIVFPRMTWAYAGNKAFGGSSAAAPQVAAAIALLRGACPALEASKVVGALLESPEVVTKSDVSKPLLRVDAALELLAESNPDSCLDATESEAVEAGASTPSAPEEAGAAGND